MSISACTTDGLRHQIILAADADADYADVDVLIKLLSGEEFLFTVSRDNSTGIILNEDDVRYAGALDEDFSGFIGEVPAHVAAKMAAVRPEAIAHFPPLRAMQ